MSHNRANTVDKEIITYLIDDLKVPHVLQAYTRRLQNQPDCNNSMHAKLVCGLHAV